MKRKQSIIRLFVVGLGFLLLLNTGADAAPTAKMIKEVVDYYYSGQSEGPILTEPSCART